MSKFGTNVLAVGGVLLATACTDDPLGVDPSPLPGDPTTIERFPAVVRAGSDALVSEIVDPFRPRLAIEIVAVGAVLPDLPVTLRLEGRAIEDISGGEVTVTLPTQAAMAHSGSGKRLSYPPNAKLPVVARWTLPAMTADDVWIKEFAVGTVEAGTYHVAVQADTRGPRNSPYILDDVYRKAWMFVMEGGGTLRGTLDALAFPSRTAPVPGPFRPKAPYRANQTGQATASGALTASYGSSVQVKVLYNERGLHLRPAVGATIWANTASVEDPDYITGATQSYTVPTSGIVRFRCPAEGYYLAGGGNLPATSEVGSGSFLGYWEATADDCNTSMQVVGTDHTYMPWSNLKEAIPRIDSGFGGYFKARQSWGTDMGHGGRSYYLQTSDRIVFGPYSFGSKFTAAHEYGHALHHKALGGLWDTEYACRTHELWEESGYRCAFQEGLADYAGKIGSRDPHPSYNFESPPTDGSDREPLTEGYVAALFWDLIDSVSDGDDDTNYSAYYVMTVFRTCKVRRRNEFGIVRTHDRENISDFVWCLENRVNRTVHNNEFRGIRAPESAGEGATEPRDWNANDIRDTWLQNVG